jgi:H+/gluconate symporter-like permease
MIAQILAIIGSVLAIIIGLWKYFGRKASARREQAIQARKDLDHANKDGDESDFLDAFGRVNK